MPDATLTSPIKCIIGTVDTASTATCFGIALPHTEHFIVPNPLNVTSHGELSPHWEHLGAVETR
jgi:hypothetical protein